MIYSSIDQGSCWIYFCPIPAKNGLMVACGVVSWNSPTYIQQKSNGRFLYAGLCYGIDQHTPGIMLDILLPNSRQKWFYGRLLYVRIGHDWV